MTNGSAAEDDRDLERWIQEATDDWRVEPLGPGQRAWYERLTPTGQRSFPARSAWRAVTGIAAAGAAVLALVLLGVSVPRQGPTPPLGGVPSATAATVASPGETAASEATAPTPTATASEGIHPTPTATASEEIDPTPTATATEGTHPTATATMSDEPPPATSVPAPVAEASDALFHLILTADKGNYTANEPIEIETTLSYIGDAPTTTVTSFGSGLVAFAIEDLTGPVDQGPSRDTTCVTYEYAAGDQEREPFMKAGAYGDDTPMDDFWREFFNDPRLRLPAGDYRISATALYGGPECGTDRELTATIDITVALPLASVPSCAEWRDLHADQRSEVAAAIVEGEGWLEAVRIAQHAEATTPDDELFGMAASSITKTCELEGWDPSLDVWAVAGAVYGSVMTGEATPSPPRP